MRDGPLSAFAPRKHVLSRSESRRSPYNWSGFGLSSHDCGACMVNFGGRWLTSFGPMELVQDGLAVNGHYTSSGQQCPIRGAIVGDRLRFYYEEPGEQGSGWF